jgi:hypothetical protein
VTFPSGAIVILDAGCCCATEWDELNAFPFVDFRQHLPMKIQGQPLRNTSTSLFPLRRGDGDPLMLALRPLSLGFHQRLRRRGIVPPVPPTRIARDSQGRPIRDAQGQAVVIADRHSTEYLQDVERYHHQVALLSVVESLQGDPNISFETIPPATDDPAAWRSYCDALSAELDEAGFAAGDLLVICREICRLSNLIDVDLAAAQRNFSSATKGTPD